MSDHYHYEYAEQRHDHRGEYASDRHEHGYYELSGVAEEYHRHHDLERDLSSVRRDLDHVIADIRELREDLRDALERIRSLEDRQPDWSDPEAGADDDPWADESDADVLARACRTPLPVPKPNPHAEEQQ